MSNLPIVIEREYFTRVKKRSFIILSLLMPFLFAAVISIPVLIESFNDTNVVNDLNAPNALTDLTDPTDLATTAVGMVLSLFIYMFVLCYGGMVMQSVMEEKSSRIIEVIVGSVKPFQLMLGKILGVMLVGLTQMLIWGIMLAAILLSVNFYGGLFGSFAPEAAEVTLDLSLPVLIPSFVLYFIGGYMLYASMLAAIGAAVNSQEDSSQFMTPVVLLMVISFYTALGSMSNPDGTLALIASMFPLTSPIVMMVRIPSGVPVWQVVLSLGILFATAIATVHACARIYRVGILLYGKKPSLKELVKWLRY